MNIQYNYPYSSISRRRNKDSDTLFFIIGLTIHAHQLKNGYQITFSSFELKSPQIEASY